MVSLTVKTRLSLGKMRFSMASQHFFWKLRPVSPAASVKYSWLS